MNSNASAASQADAEQDQQTVDLRSALRRSSGEKHASPLSGDRGVWFSGGSGEAGGTGSKEQPSEQDSLRSAIAKWDSKLANSRTFWHAARKTGQLPLRQP